MALINRSSARPKLVEPDGYGSPARASLAIAIKSRDSLRAGADQIWNVAQHYETERLQPLRDAVERANSALGVAKSAVTSAIIDNIVQDNAIEQKPDAIREARIVLQVAKDELAAAEDAYGRLEPRRVQMQADADEAGKQVHRLAADVLRDHLLVRTVCKAHEEHMRGFLQTLGLIAWMNKNNVFGVRDAHGFPVNIESYSAIESLLLRKNNPPSTWSIGSAKGGGIMQFAAADWQQSFDALQTDANAPLPPENF